VWLSSFNTTKNLDAYLIHGLIATLFARPSTLPKSFQFDLKRLEQFQTDIQDIVHLKAALLVFDELHSWLAPGQGIAASLNTYAELQSRIRAMVEEQPDEAEPWQACPAGMALEITRAACAIVGNSQSVVPNRLIQCTFLRLDEMFSGQTTQSAQIWESTREDLTNRAIQNAQTFNDMTPLAMSEAQHQWQQQRDGKSGSRLLPEVEDISRRVAHLGIYLEDREETF
jgi:hypothetical protein